MGVIPAALLAMMLPLILASVTHLIFGLAPGRYAVTQDTLAVGTFTAGACGGIVFSAPAVAPITIERVAADQKPSAAGVE